MPNKALAPRRRERFRYISGPLYGKWRWSFCEAVEDAIKAGQATEGTEASDAITWLAGGRIECETVAEISTIGRTSKRL